MVRLLVRLGVTPNALTLAGLAGAVAAGALILAGWWVAAGIVFVVASLMDTLDGSVARATGTATPFGAFLDSTFDRLAEGVVLGAVAIAFAEDGGVWAAALAVVALTASFLVSYTRARAEGLGITSNRGGLMSRPERLVLTGFVIFAAPVSWLTAQIAVAVLAGLTLLTVAQRMIHVRSALAAGDHHPKEGIPTP